MDVMTTYDTQFTETEALLAALQDEEGTMMEIVRDMLPSEIDALRRACDMLRDGCRIVLREQRGDR